jgi:hypothetical protein
MEDWEQLDNLPTRTVLAVLAPGNTFWLAETCSILLPTQMKVMIRWLKEKSNTSRRNPHHRLFAVDSAWDPSFIWRDSIIAELSDSSKSDENDVWHIQRDILEVVQQQAVKLNEPSTLQQPTQIQEITMNDGQDINESTFDLLKKRCVACIEQVQYYENLCCKVKS